MAAMIVAGAALTGALIALFVCFSKKGKRCKQSEKEKKLSAETGDRLRLRAADLRKMQCRPEKNEERLCCRSPFVLSRKDLGEREKEQTYVSYRSACCDFRFGVQLRAYVWNCNRVSGL